MKKDDLQAHTDEDFPAAGPHSIAGADE